MQIALDFPCKTFPPLALIQDGCLLLIKTGANLCRGLFRGTTVYTFKYMYTIYTYTQTNIYTCIYSIQSFISKYISIQHGMIHIYTLKHGKYNQ